MDPSCKKSPTQLTHTLLIKQVLNNLQLQKIIALFNIILNLNSEDTVLTEICEKGPCCIATPYSSYVVFILFHFVFFLFLPLVVCFFPLYCQHKLITSALMLLSNWVWEKQ